MNIKELLVDLPEDKASALSEAFEVLQGEVTKLNQVKDNLFDEKAKWKTEKETALEEAERIKNESLKKAGDFETYESNLKSQHQAEIDKYKDQLTKRDTMILGKANEAVINELAGQFVDSNVGKVMLKNLVQTNYSESGEVTTSLNGLDGQSLTSDVAKFAETLKGIDGFSSVLKGADSSGGGSQGSNSGASASNDPDAAFKQRIKDALGK